MGDGSKEGWRGGGEGGRLDMIKYAYIVVSEQTLLICTIKESNKGCGEGSAVKALSTSVMTGVDNLRTHVGMAGLL